MWLIPVIALILLAIILFNVIKCLIGSHHLKNASTFCCNVFGPKGSGKSLIFSKMTTYYKTGYLSTNEFFHKGEILIDVKDINVDPNTSLKTLNGRFEKVKGGWHEEWEGSPVFLDDCGIYLPNYMDSTLKKVYPSLPLAYALWRHCYNAPIHINSQDPQRVWKPLREQQEMWILAQGVRKIGPFLFVHGTIYDREESALKRLAPMKSYLFNKFNSAELNEFVATNGYIKNFTVCCLTFNHRYDSRYFLSRLYEMEKGELIDEKK